jgi:hypothetical protein
VADRPTLTQLVQELTRRFDDVVSDFKEYLIVTDNDVKRLEAELAERKKAEERLSDRVDELMRKNAVLEERCRNLEKLSDRNWQGWLALIAAGVAILIALFKK